MEILTYKDLVARYGQDLAFDLLLSIEKVARTRNGTGQFDEETRLQKALEALDKQSPVASHPQPEKQRTAQ